MLAQSCSRERAVVLTSPCCRLRSQLQATNVARWKHNVSAAYFKDRMVTFLRDRRTARSAVRFAGRLHSLVDKACAECSGASGLIHCVRLREQPSTARMAPVSVRADSLVGNAWPAAWTPLGVHADVALCAVGYGPKTLKRYGKALRFQIRGCDPLLSVLRRCQCRCTEPHDACQGSMLKDTAFYSTTLAYYLVLGARCT